MHTKTTSTLKGGIIVAHGYGLKVRVENRHLIVEDGFGRQRRTPRFHRTSKLGRLVLIGRSGYVTLDALRWLHDTGASFLHVDTNSELIAASNTGGPDLAGLRRAQALAVDSAAGVEIARAILTTKVEGQRAVIGELAGAEGGDLMRWALGEIETAADLGALLAAEAQAAAAYWAQWTPIEVRFAPRDARKLPSHWQTFGQRASLITGAPRTATNPANAILNYLYALLEAETILACHAVGLDAGLGIFHNDRRARASLALDLMEAVRPAVDAYVLALLTQRTLSAREFLETREGGCRITPRFAAELAETCEVWRSHVAPVVEQAAHTLAAHSSSRVPVSTPLTGRNWKRAWDERAPDRKRRQSRADFAQLPCTCRDCGASLPDRRHRYCESCRRERWIEQASRGRRNAAAVLSHLRFDERDPAHGGRAAELRGSKNAAHQAAVRAWKGGHPDPEVFRSEVLPRLRQARIAELVAATGLSEHYCSLIRLGKRVPHPRHWEPLRRVAVPGNEPRTGSPIASA